MQVSFHKSVIILSTCSRLAGLISLRMKVRRHFCSSYLKTCAFTPTFSMSPVQNIGCMAMPCQSNKPDGLMSTRSPTEAM